VTNETPIMAASTELTKVVITSSNPDHENEDPEVIINEQQS
jgi:hypothetical protein